jgi:2,5-diketo-D-gluconate reductase B
MAVVEVQGERVPALGLGTWELNGARCRRAVQYALEVGYRHIDTAQMYGNEAEIGTALQTQAVDRVDLWITTKIGNSDHAPDAVQRSTEESLRRLRTDYVDLLLIHWPVAFESLPRTLEAMESLRDQGKVRYLGVSNFTPAQVELALTHAPLLAVQVEYHPFLGQRALMNLCRSRDLMLTAYAPLARGQVTDDPTIKEVAQRYGKTPSQVTLRWLLDQEGVSAIPKASSQAHLQENIQLFDFELTDQDRAALDSLEANQRLIDPPFAPDWER